VGEVERHRGELEGGASLEEQHAVLVGDPHELTQPGLGPPGHGFEGLRAVARLEDRRPFGPRAGEVVDDPVEYRRRECRRPRSVVVGLCSHGPTLSPVVRRSSTAWVLCSAGPQVETAPHPDQRRLLPLIVTITGMGVLGFAIIAPALPDLADELGVSRGAIGLVQGAIAVPGIFLAGYIGYLADRVGRRRVIRTSLIIFGLAGLASFFARSYWLLIAARLLQGVGTSGLLGMGVVVIGDIFTGHRRRWAMGINIAGLTAVTTLAPIVGGFLAEGGAFRPFLVYVVAFPVFLWARRLAGCDASGGDLPCPAAPDRGTAPVASAGPAVRLPRHAPDVVPDPRDLPRPRAHRAAAVPRGRVRTHRLAPWHGAGDLGRVEQRGLGAVREGGDPIRSRRP
jgi:hypothetical protein